MVDMQNDTIIWWCQEKRGSRKGAKVKRCLETFEQLAISPEAGFMTDFLEIRIQERNRGRCYLLNLWSADYTDLRMKNNPQITQITRIKKEK